MAGTQRIRERSRTEIDPHGASPPQLASILGLPDPRGVHVQGREPAAAVAIGVDALQLAQVQDRAALLRRMPGDDRLARAMRPGEPIPQSRNRESFPRRSAGSGTCRVPRPRGARNGQEFGRSWAGQSGPAEREAGLHPVARRRTRRPAARVHPLSSEQDAWVIVM